ncbi:uncharacterized protein PG986_002484 [Apiospora aurea]|uniref:Uncharacterized protein n=1 Tax=Apiospora aurea TaxID=335848 RepID=A0ABR1QNY5_9PEZI
MCTVDVHDYICGNCFEVVGRVQNEATFVACDHKDAYMPGCPNYVPNTTVRSEGDLCGGCARLIRREQALEKAQEAYDKAQEEAYEKAQEAYEKAQDEAYEKAYQEAYEKAEEEANEK